MTSKTIETIETLVAEYRDLASRQGQGKTAHESNAAAEQLAATFRELRARGADALERVLPLLRDGDAYVRCWAAAHLLGHSPELAAAVLEELAAGPPGPIRASASMTLREWRAGRLRFP